jgi:hypothetical protein
MLSIQINRHTKIIDLPFISGLQLLYFIPELLNLFFVINVNVCISSYISCSPENCALCVVLYPSLLGALYAQVVESSWFIASLPHFSVGSQQNY